METRKRTRTVIKSGLVGSSELWKIKSKRSSGRSNHEKNADYFASLNSKPLKEKTITEEYLLSRYSRVKVMGKWESIMKYAGILVFMYNNDKYQMM